MGGMEPEKIAAGAQGSLDGTTLPNDAAALVWSPREGFYFLIPDQEEGLVAVEIKLMWAMATKLLTDPEFAEQLLEDWDNLVYTRLQ